MKVVRLLQNRLTRSLQFKKSSPFAQLAKESEVNDDVNKYTNAREYYDYVLRFSNQDSRGYLELQASQFTKMVKIAADQQDIASIRDALYNYIGHKQKLTNKQVDAYLQKAIELNSAETVNEILINHNYLMYYPQSSVLHALTQHYIQTANAAGLQQLTRIFANGHFLKVQPNSISDAAAFAVEQNDQSILLNLAQIAYKKNLQISETAINHLLVGIARFKIANTQPKEGSGNKIETKFLEHIKKCSQSYHTIIGKAYLSLAHKDIDGALVNLANYHQVKESKANIISNDALTIEFFQLLETQITESQKPKYAERLAKVASDIQSKLGQQAIHPDVLAIIQKITSAKQSAETSEQQ